MQLSLKIASIRIHLDLETGEVFENPRYARVRKRSEGSTISAQLNIYQASKALDLTYNRMQYLEERASDDDHLPSSIYFSCFLPPQDFQALLSNIQNGILPSTALIELEWSFQEKSQPLEYGWEPDGSGMKWRNKENKRVKIESIGFRYEILKASFDSETGEIIAPETTSTSEVLNQHASELKGKLTQAIKEIRYVGWIVVGAALLLTFILR